LEEDFRRVHRGAHKDIGYLEKEETGEGQEKRKYFKSLRNKHV